MSIRVLIVDDSSFFRRRLTEILSADPELEVIDTANDGRDAVTKALALKPDVITMDIEMPILDGISAVREILQSQRIPILMFSSLTHEGAKATFDALDAGAVDFLPKKFEDIARDKEEAGMVLRDRVKAVARKKPLGRSTFSASGTPLNTAGNTFGNVSSAGVNTSPLQVSGHWHLNRWSCCVAADPDQFTCQFSFANYFNSTYACSVYRCLCSAPEQPG
jgi:two-component system chemotaxis response regulator CheB